MNIFLKTFFLYAAAVLSSCSQNQNGASETIPFAGSTELAFSSVGEIFTDGHFIVPDISGDGSYLFSSPEQVIFHNRKLYISDGWRNGKILVFDFDGNPVTSLDRKGRGDGEYLQISHFDIDKDGNFWILDGRRDRILKYNQDRLLIASFDLECQVDKIKCLDNGNLLLSTASWDNSKYKDKSVLLADPNLNIISSVIDKPENTDPNFMFPAQGFIGTGTGILYHVPVDDHIYGLSFDGELEQSYFIDFKGKSIPEDFRSNIESHYDELERFLTLVNSVYIDKDVALGSVLYEGDVKDFIIDRQKDRLYLSDEPYDSMHLVGISGNYAVFYIPAGYSGEIPYMPDSVKEEYDLGKDLFLILDINAIK